MSSALRIGYIPEHFSTPLYFAIKHFSLNATLIPFPSGTGHLVTSLHDDEIDVAIGLTEGFVTALGNQGKNAKFKLIGTYVETPLCWAISASPKSPIKDVHDLKGKKIGVSRLGSGSHVMGFVLADAQNWLTASGQLPFPVVPLQNFRNLRNAVDDGSADFFMWEHFTCKRYFDNGEIKKVGEIYTPWSSWKIAARNADDLRLQELFKKLNEGIQYFVKNPVEAVDYISSELDYSQDDAREWLKTVKFADNVKGVKYETVHKTIDILSKAGVIPRDAKVEKMINITSDES